MADDGDVFRKLDQVSIGSAAHLLRVLHELGRGDKPRTTPAGSEAPNTRDVVYDVARFLLTGYEEFLRLQERYFDVVADGVRDLTRAPSYGTATITRERLVIEGTLGGTAKGRFRLENEQDTDVVFSFRFNEFSATRDDRCFPAAVSIRLPTADAARASDRHLAAGERRVYEVAVQLDPATFEPYLSYVADIDVMRDGKAVAVLTLEVSAKP